MKILKKLNSPINFSKKIFAFDVETFQTKKEKYIQQDFLCGSVVGDNNTRRFFKDRVEMANFLLSTPLRNSYIYATNLEFDFFHIFKDDPRIKDFFMIDRNGIIYSKYCKDPPNSFSFIDTWNYTGKIKLSKMGKLLNIPKLPAPSCFKHTPQNFDEWEDMKAYNIRDSEITYQFASFYCRDFCRKINAKPKITLASTGQDFWRRNHQPSDIFQEDKSIIYKHYLGSVHGGRTENIKRGYFDRRLWYYDFNSHYPAQNYSGMDGKGSYPDPSYSRYTDDADIVHITEYPGISRVDIEAPEIYIPILGISYEGKYIFPKGSFSGWFCHTELKKALKKGYEIKKIHESIYYTSDFVPFRDAVRYLYGLRKSYKKEGNEIMQMMVKTLMNSGLFGKFAQKIDEKTIIKHIDNISLDSRGGLFYKEKDKKIPLKDYIRRGDFFFEKIKKEDGKLPIFINPILASYTTSLGRLKLFEHLDQSPHDMIYCDTDSIVCKKPLFETSSKLGALKLEKVIDESIFIRPKMYYIYHDGKEEIKSKGMGKITSKAELMSYARGERYERERFLRLKESYVRDIPFSSIINSPKDLNTEDNKRVWESPFSMDASQDSSPIELDEGIPLHIIERKNYEIMQKMEEQKIEELLHTDFFDSMGDDITKKEFMDNEMLQR